MATTTLLALQPDAMSPAQLAAVSYLARSRGSTHRLYTFQLRRWFDWCEVNHLDPLVGGGTRLRQWMCMGPAPSGLTPAIEAMPDKEERIIARRLDEHRANMAATVAGIKELAESAP